MREISRSRTWAVAAAGGVAALLTAACGSSSTGGANTASAPGVTATTVTIGSTQPLTGPAAPGYSEIAPAANAYFKYVNAHGGVNGRKITYTYLDDQYNPTSTATQTRKLVLQDQVFAMFQALGTPTHLSVVTYLNSEHVPDLFVASGCNCWNNTAQYPDTFGWQPNYTIEGKILGQYIATNFASKKVGFFIQGPNDEFGTDGFMGVMDLLQGKGLNVAATPAYYTPTAAGAMAVGAAIAGLQAQGVQVIVNFSVPLFTAIAEASAAGLNYHPQFVVSNVGSDPPTLAAILTGGALGKKLPAGLIGGTISDTYLPLLTDATNPWVTFFKGIEATYAPSLPWDGNVEYGMSVARRGGNAAVGHDGRGLVAVAELDVELAELHRLRAHRPQHGRAVRGILGPAAPHPAQLLHVLLGRVLMGDAQRRADLEVVDRVLQRALRVALIDRPALGLVGIQQRR